MEGRVIKGAGKRSLAGTLVERPPGFVVLEKMDNSIVKTVVASITVVLNGEPMAMRKTMTCDQGREMLGRKILTERTGLRIGFANPHGPWQRGQRERQRSAAPAHIQRHRLIDLLPGGVECHCVVAQYTSTDQDWI